MFDVKFSMFLDRPHVMARLTKYQRKVLGATGAFARQAMKRMIRPALKGSKKSRTISVVPNATDMPPSWKGLPPSVVICVVQAKGPVIDARTGRPVAAGIARKAKEAYFASIKGRGEGQPPRRGPSDLLRRFIFFGIDEHRETVVIGPMRFGSQPVMPNRVSVPELLNKGGIEIIFGKPVQYGPRPFVEPTLPIAEKKMAELIEKTPPS
jgi:hypothetical protein